MPDRFSRRTSSIKLTRPRSKRNRRDVRSVLKSLRFVGDHAEHADIRGLAVALNGSLVDRELDLGVGSQRAAAVFLILDGINVPLQSEHAVTHEAAVLSCRNAGPFAI